MYNSEGHTKKELIGEPFGLPWISNTVTEIDIIRKTGSAGIAEMRVDNTEWEGKQAKLISLRDITVQRKMEEKLLQAQKLESVGVLAGGIAHDFNNILPTVLGNANLADIFIKAGNIDKAIEAISTIERASIRARDLTQQLIAFSKGGSPVKKTVTIAGLIKESAGFVIRVLSEML